MRNACDFLLYALLYKKGNIILVGNGMMVWLSTIIKWKHYQLPLPHLLHRDNLTQIHFMAPHQTRYTFYLFGLLWKCAHKHIINIKGHKSKSHMVWVQNTERKCEMERKGLKKMKEDPLTQGQFFLEQYLS